MVALTLSPHTDSLNGPGAAIMDAMKSKDHSRIKRTKTLIIPKLDNKAKGLS
jgi:hypothetical protein